MPLLTSNIGAGPIGFMARLARDTRGNALAIMAAAMIPLAGLVGGGIDISRMYITKTRLQHACDAGALAGRKAMGGGTWAQNGGMPGKTAAEFFNANFKSGAYGSGSVTSRFTENAGKVTGAASAALPMTLMRIFGKKTETLAVTCDAEMRLPNTDVMFVLDVSGSMGDKAVSSDPDTKIQSLRSSVKCFYEIVARLDTDATCSTGNPGSGGTGGEVQIRFGFVNYSANVNVGKLLPNSFFPDSWDYQTRVANWDPPGTTTNGPYWETYGGGGISQSDCLKFMTNRSFNGFSPTPSTSGGPAPAPTTVITFNSDGSASQGGNGEWGWNGAPDTSGNSRSCRRSRTDATTTYVPSFRDWTYKQAPITISGLKAGGSSWNNSIQVPIGQNGTNTTVGWDGCIEERQTVSGTSFSPIPAAAKDLDIDTAPTPGDPSTQWKPALPRVIYMRKNGNNYTTAAVTTSSNYSQPDASCPAEARKLQTWPSASTFDNYVDSLNPTVNTYHDIGLLWGARLMSPTGIFGSENIHTPKGGEIERHLIFMTDGDTNTSTSDYAAYGIPWWDKRNVSNPGNSPGSDNMNAETNARFLALCSAVKNKNITLWVISFGSGSNSTTEDRLSQCATTGRYFTARDSASLQNTFASIADQISQLRLTQ